MREWCVYQKTDGMKQSSTEAMGYTLWKREKVLAALSTRQRARRSESELLCDGLDERVLDSERTSNGRRSTLPRLGLV